MGYKYEYKDIEERESIINNHTDLFLIEEQNITEGNFLIFVDSQTYEEMQSTQLLKERTSSINDYINLNPESVTELENAILEIEKNKILEGMI